VKQPDIVNLLVLTDQLFPAAEWTDALRELLAASLIDLEIPLWEAEAALRGYRLNCRWKTPDIGALVNAIRVAAQAARIRSAPVAVDSYDPSHPPVTGWHHELARRLDNDPTDAIFGKLAARGLTISEATNGLRD
jgi:hypothetical protein